MDNDRIEVSVDELLGWAVEQGDFLPPGLPCSREDAIELSAVFYSKFRSFLAQLEDYSLLDQGLSSVVRSRTELLELCAENGVSVPARFR